MTHQKFIAELKQNVANFEKNISVMPSFTGDQNNYADWHRMFTKWCEVGTEMEKQYYPSSEQTTSSTQTLNLGKYGDVTFVQQDSCYVPSAEKDGLSFNMYWNATHYEIQVSKLNKQKSGRGVGIYDLVETLIIPK